MISDPQPWCPNGWAATPGPWRRDEDYIRGPDGEYVAKVNRTTNAELILWLRNHADAIVALIDAADALVQPAGWWMGVEQRQEHQLLDRRAVVRDALAALEADR